MASDIEIFRFKSGLGYASLMIPSSGDDALVGILANDRLMGVSAELSIQNEFVKGVSETWLSLEDIREWRAFLHSVGRGEMATWRELSRSMPIVAQPREDESFWVEFIEEDTHVSMNMDYSSDWLTFSLGLVDRAEDILTEKRYA